MENNYTVLSYSNLKKFIVACLLIMFLSTSVVHAEEKESTETNLPKPVKNVVSSVFPQFEQFKNLLSTLEYKVSFTKIDDSNRFEDIKSMWVWGKAHDIVNDSQEQDKFFNFVEDKQITRLFFFGDHLNLKYKTDTVASFIERARKKGVEVEYLAGRAYWVKDGKTHEAINRCEKVVKYNKKVGPESQFSGVHFDIEPHQLGAAWFRNSSSGNDNYNDEFENNFYHILKTCREKFNQADQDLSLSVDLGSDYSYYVTDLMNKIDTEDTPIDYITIMNYFDNKNQFLNGYSWGEFGGVKHNIRLINHVPLVFGAETGGAPADWRTFAEEGVSAMENVFDAARENYGDKDQFAGVSVHYYKSFSNLAQ